MANRDTDLTIFGSEIVTQPDVQIRMSLLKISHTNISAQILISNRQILNIPWFQTLEQEPAGFFSWNRGLAHSQRPGTDIRSRGFSHIQRIQPILRRIDILRHVWRHLLGLLLFIELLQIKTEYMQ